MIFSMIILLIFVLIMVLCFVITLIRRNEGQTEGSDRDMFKQLYIYLVLFTTLIMTISGGVGVFMGLADIASPNLYIERYSEYKMRAGIEYDKNGNEIKAPKKAEEELRKEYEQMVKDEEQRSRQSAINTIIKSTGFIVIPLPVFLYFNRLRKRSG